MPVARSAHAALFSVRRLFFIARKGCCGLGNAVMHRPKPAGKIVFQTPWFEIFSKEVPGSKGPFYSIHAPDFAVVVAVTVRGELLMVRQFRPVVKAMTLELPAGHVDLGETPEQSIRKELREETGYEAEKFELVATLSPSTARFTNRLFCFFAGNATREKKPRLERGMKPVLYKKGFRALLAEKEFYSSGSCAALFAAAVRGRIEL
jgi:ADP-ribose pyrophosphatase